MPCSATARSTSSSLVTSPATKLTTALWSPESRASRRRESVSRSKIHGLSPRSTRLFTTQAPMNPLAPVMRNRGRAVPPVDDELDWFMPCIIMSSFFRVKNYSGIRLIEVKAKRREIKNQKSKSKKSKIKTAIAQIADALEVEVEDVRQAVLY